MSSKTTFLKSNEIAEAIKKCQPQSIAVAFIGRDWKKYIDPISVDKIIISPTIGSNPEAIIDLVKRLTWEKVLFLDNLHAKTYIGKGSVVIGSSNLTANGLSADGLEEAAVVSRENSIIKDTVKNFQHLERLALQQYPNTANKEIKLSKLKEIWSKAISYSIINNDKHHDVELLEYSPLADDDFYIVYYEKSSDSELSEEMDYIKESFERDMLIPEGDDVVAGKWMLCWRITDQKKPHKTENPYWLFVHDVFSKAVNKKYLDDCTALAVQRVGKKTTNPPFELTKPVIKAFKSTMSKKEFLPHFVFDSQNNYSVSTSFPFFKKFINELKSLIKRNE